MIRRGCPANRENRTPRVAVEMMSSETPIMPSVFSPVQAGRGKMLTQVWHSPAVIQGFVLCLYRRRTKQCSIKTLVKMPYPAVLQRWWWATGQQSRWRWQLRYTGRPRHPWGRWRSAGSAGGCRESDLRRESQSVSEGRPPTPPPPAHPGSPLVKDKHSEGFFF